MKALIASILLALILIVLAVLPAWMPSQRSRKRKIYILAVTLLASVGFVVAVLQGVFQYQEAKKNAELQQETLRIVRELVAQKRLSPEDGQRLLKLTEHVGITDETKVELNPRQKGNP